MTDQQRRSRGEFRTTEPSPHGVCDGRAVVTDGLGNTTVLEFTRDEYGLEGLHFGGGAFLRLPAILALSRFLLDGAADLRDHSYQQLTVEDCAALEAARTELRKVGRLKEARAAGTDDAPLDPSPF